MILEIFPDGRMLIESALRLILARAEAAIRARRSFSLVLAGGRTPLELYRLWGRPPWSDATPWDRMDLFWGDERCVAPGDEASNYRSAIEAFGPGVVFSPDRLHRMPAEEGPQKGARLYQRELEAYFGGKDNIVFDFLILGMGDDGHVASLFEGSKALDSADPATAVADSPAARPPVPRVTLTMPVINSSRLILLIVTGKNKAGAVRKVLKSPGAERTPAAMVKPKGELFWFLDREAWD
jgi:6-phosphogluconolactonase